jgi:hypothetical protein
MFSCPVHEGSLLTQARCGVWSVYSYYVLCGLNKDWGLDVVHPMGIMCGFDVQPSARNAQHEVMNVLP